MRSKVQKSPNNESFIVQYNPDSVPFSSDRSHQENADDICPLFVDSAIWIRIRYYSRFRRIINYLDTNPSLVVHLDDLAKASYMSSTALSKLFKAKTGATLKHFLSSYKISKAHEMMIATDSSITEIADALGFASLSTFERTFRRITGQTPREYRTQVLTKNRILICNDNGALHTP